ncbi:hypothetical protein E4T44_02457 [Aureobasidium sp. EXF-8845]|nr:hypothetical protein E4T44_02457 [Aureobasidium sp. EXF-8845]KAI4856673.1 hypothetical protein E4T45_01857 [Aureobasidium sp. EXF-8846]
MSLNAIVNAPLSPEKLVIFCDGTWCGPEHGTRTNIQLLAEMVGIDMETSRGSREIIDASRQLRARYFNGLNCNYLTYGFGGSADNIGQLSLKIYRYIAQHYEIGTEIWLFGLGRGAYALRCVVGMINNCGIIKEPSEELCDLVFQTYTSPRENDKPSSDHSEDFRRRTSWNVASPIKIMVLLDTIGSIGHTYNRTGSGVTLWDEEIPDVVERVYHACSIHDRLPLLPLCLATKADHSSTPRISETWFPGCHYDIGRQRCQALPQGLLYLVPRLFSGVVEPNHVLSNSVLCWVLQCIAQQFPSQTVFQDSHWRISFLKKSIKSPTTGTGSGDVYGPSKTPLYAPFGRILTRLPIIPSMLGSAVSMLPLRDRRIPDQAANVVDFETQRHSEDERSLAEMARVDSQRYPSRAYEAWKAWTRHAIAIKDRKAISWADESARDTHKLLQIESKQHETPRLPTTSHTSIHDDNSSIASTPTRCDSVDPQNIVLTASDDALMRAVIDSDTVLVQDLLKEKASKLAFDFEWLGELIELGHSVEDIATVLVEEESESPWLLVSGGNFGKRVLKMAKRLERMKKAGDRS